MFKRMGTAALLASISIAGCDCEDPQQFLPAATYVPDDVLDFGVVSVLSQRQLPIEVRSNGSAALVVDGTAWTIDPQAKDAWNPERTAFNEAGTFRVDFADDLASLAPRTTSTITVTYRPCPDAWEGGWAGNTLKEGYDFGSCPDGAEQITLTLRDNTRVTEEDGGIPIAVSGRPGQPPQLELVCQQGTGHCNEMADLASAVGCVSLTFGEVNAAEEACDLQLEVRNKKRNSKDTGDLIIERMEVLVFDAQDPNRTLRDGAEVGFSVLNDDGTPLVVDTDNPLTIPIPLGANEGVRKLKVRFNGAAPGDWVGTAQLQGGLRVYSNDPDADKQPVKSVLVSGSGTAPDIQVLHPGKIDFGSVQQGTTSTGSATVRNNGNAILTINSLALRDTTGVFSYTTSMGMPPFEVMPAGTGANTFDVTVTYAPSGTGFDADALVVGSNDVDTPELPIPLSGGAVPQISVTPSPTMTFPLGEEVREEDLIISNIGFGDLVIQRFTVLGPAPEDDPNHSSVNDFSIEGCSENPCPQNITLCAPGSPGCVDSSVTLKVSYENDDVSSTDLVSLRIASNDPVNSEWTVVLSAEDVPCFFPSPVMTVETPMQDRKVGQPIIVNGNSSTPGSGMGITAFDWFFQFAPAGFPTISEVTPGDASRIQFTADAPGLYILALDVTNDCGAVSETTRTERINVSPE